MTWIHATKQKAIDLLSPNLQHITIQDAAHSLARINRFTGWTDGPWGLSVAQHCVHVAEHLPEELKIAGLAHDIHEMIVGDVSTPMKLAMRALAGDTDYRSPFDELDERARRAVFARWGIQNTTHRLVKLADLRALVTERRDLLGPEAMPWNIRFEGDLVQPWDERIDPWTPEQAEFTFLHRFTSYGGVDAKVAA